MLYKLTYLLTYLLTYYRQVVTLLILTLYQRILSHKCINNYKKAKLKTHFNFKKTSNKRIFKKLPHLLINFQSFGK